MHETIIEKAQRCPFTAPALRDLAADLPPDAATLDTLLQQTVRALDERGFSHLLLAALAAGRRVDARHLVEGAALLLDPCILTAAALHCDGAVPEALVEAVRLGKMSWEREAVALLTAAWWCRKHRGGESPPRLLAQARILARRSLGHMEAQLALLALAELLEDPGLRADLAAVDIPPLREMAQRLLTTLLEPAALSPLEGVPEQAPPTIRTGYTVRRAVERIGRNEPCPCGSGKKYKRCCYDTDQERLRQSSHVPGVTVEELHAHREKFLDHTQLDRMRSFELARLDFRQIPREFYPHLLNRLDMFHEFGAVIRFFTEVGYSHDWDTYLLQTVDTAASCGDSESVHRLLALRGTPPEGAEEPNFGATLLASADALDPLLVRLEAEAKHLVSAEHAYEAVDFACDLTSSPLPALGLLIARGVLPLAAEWDRDVLLEGILDARDRLGLGLDDPIETLLPNLTGTRAPAARTETDAPAAAHQQELHAKQAEMRELRAELAALKDKLAAAETQAATPPPPAATQVAAPQPPGPDPALIELRRRVATLKDELKQRHQERNQLRKELRDTHLRLQEEGPRQPPPAATAPDAAHAQEEALVLPEAAEPGQPVRIPVCATPFTSQLAEHPPQVARAALRLLGELAAGDTAAFRGARRLRRDRDLWRQRVGLGHRLLFRLEPQHLEAVALVSRQDFERTVKHLTD